MLLANRALCLPLRVLSPVIGVLEQGRADDAEGEEEAHGEAEEQGGTQAEGQNHRVGIQGTALLLELATCSREKCQVSGFTWIY